MARWWLVEQQQIFNIITDPLTYLLTKVLLGTPTVSIMLVWYSRLFVWLKLWPLHYQKPRQNMNKYLEIENILKTALDLSDWEGVEAASPVNECKCIYLLLMSSKWHKCTKQKCFLKLLMSSQNHHIAVIREENLLGKGIIVLTAICPFYATDIFSIKKEIHFITNNFSYPFDPGRHLVCLWGAEVNI